MRRALARLRWQLTLSHLIAIVVTLVSMVAALISIAGSWIAVQTSPDREAANDARIVARSVGPPVELGGESDTLNVVLRGLAQGKIRAQIGPGPFAPEPAYRIEGIGPSLRGLSYVVIVGPDGRVIASSDPSGTLCHPRFGASSTVPDSGWIWPAHATPSEAMPSRDLTRSATLRRSVSRTPAGPRAGAVRVSTLERRLGRDPASRLARLRREGAVVVDQDIGTRGLRHRLRLGAEDLDGERMLVGGDAQIAERSLVAMVQSRTADHLRAHEPGAVAPSLAAERLHAHARHRRQYEPRRYLDRPNPPGRAQIYLHRA